MSKELYQVVRNAISLEMCKLIKDTLIISKDVSYFINDVPLENTTAFGDDQCAYSFVTYSHHVTEALLLTVQPFVEKFTGFKLFPTYSYSRIYWKNSVLRKHTDRPSCQYSATLCIDNDPQPWEIFMGGTPVRLNPGDLVCYKGCEIEHWREPYTGNQQIQVFLHYVDQEDIYCNYKFDQRPLLGLVKDNHGKVDN